MAKKKDIPKNHAPSVILPDLSKLTISITGKTEPAMPVDTLAADLGISPPVLAGLKTAYGWTPSTRITRGEFAGKVKSWLASPVVPVSQLAGSQVQPNNRTTGQLNNRSDGKERS